MGAGATIQVPSEFENLSTEHRDQYAEKFQALVNTGNSPDDALASLLERHTGVDVRFNCLPPLWKHVDFQFHLQFSSLHFHPENLDPSPLQKLFSCPSTQRFNFVRNYNYLSHFQTTQIFEISLPSNEHEMGAHTASLVMIQGRDGEDVVARPYTPVSLNGDFVAWRQFLMHSFFQIFMTAKTKRGALKLSSKLIREESCPAICTAFKWVKVFDK